MNRHICQLELQEGCACGHVCELPAQPRGLAAKPPCSRCEGPGWPSNSRSPMENKALQHGAWLLRKGGDGTSPPAPFSGGSSASTRMLRPEAARPMHQGCGVRGVSLLGCETFPAQPQLHLPGVGSLQRCDGDPSKVWVGKMCSSQ